MQQWRNVYGASFSPPHPHPPPHPAPFRDIDVETARELLGVYIGHKTDWLACSQWHVHKGSECEVEGGSDFSMARATTGVGRQ